MEVHLYDIPSSISTLSSYQNPTISTPILTIVTVRCIPRSTLPLAWLDTSAAPQQRLFSSSNPALDSLFTDSAKDPVILLASKKNDKKHCAIEKVKSGIFALCWIIDHFEPESLSFSNHPPSIKRKHEESTSHSNWWSCASLPQSALDLLSRPAKKPRSDTTKPAFPSPKAIEPAQESLVTELPLDKDTLFDTLVTQYLDALYLNRTSLAFFAKGPLTRIKTTFSSSDHKHLSICELATFLRSMILSSTVMDRKYKQKLPEYLQSIAINASDLDTDKPKRKLTKKRKLKISPSGLYSFEMEYIQKWWRLDEEVVINRGESGKQSIARRIKQLRIRETLSQIMLVLELSSLESMADLKSIEQTETVQQYATDDKMKRKVKKPLDLSKHLDHLIDMLLIWQTIDLDSDSIGLNPTKEKDVQSWVKDRLVGFCVDVIIPFYRNSAPKLAAHVVHKFGGPSQSSDKRRRQEKPDKPGNLRKESSRSNLMQSNIEQNAVPTHRQLQRTSSLSTSTRSHTGLKRSSTDSSFSASQAKREASETPSLSSFPHFLDRRPKKTTSLKHLQKRQISISSLESNPNTQSKRKQESTQQDELKNAINFIKKPNRTGVSQAFADERDHRAASSATKPKSQSRPMKPSPANRKALHAVENIQVMATPHAGRKIDVFAQPAPAPALALAPTTDAITSPEMTSWRIISSSNPSTAKRATSGTITNQSIIDTPCREGSRAMIFASPEAVRHSTIAHSDTTARPVFLAADFASTPVRPQNNILMATMITPIPSTPLQVQKTLKAAATPTIYGNLGWDNYDFDE